MLPKLVVQYRDLVLQLLGTSRLGCADSREGSVCRRGKSHRSTGGTGAQGALSAA